MSECALPGCTNKARIRFCSNKHKDMYHNIKNPRGYYAYLNPQNDDNYDPDDHTHPFSSEALGQD